jgi:membrane protein required for colicin V production
MSLLDIIVLAVIVLFGIAGAKRGLLWEICSLIGMAVGLWIPWIFRSQIVDFAAACFGTSQWRIPATVIAFLFVFSAIYLGFSYLGFLLHKLLEKIFLGWIDHVLGAIIGLIKGVVIVAILLVALMISPWNEQGQAFIQRSKLLRWGKVQIERVLDVQPSSLRSWV